MEFASEVPYLGTSEIAHRHGDWQRPSVKTPQNHLIVVRTEVSNVDDLRHEAIPPYEVSRRDSSQGRQRAQLLNC